ncbi:peptidyl-prolyl cis-trans isomerase [Bacillus sp. 165]|uniref:peptidyl-prolyl cis-trans isomerase n=1 Tax=Bacillus sp. 165 TaxID=1529117 RepID=UPI001AD9B2A4|nr:peptidyl-prolyl cis-trans isomerase [Bacillus sp. 165]
MDNIVTINGKVNYIITLDPGVWIFDDRKVDLTTYFIEEKQEHNELEQYLKSTSMHWDREIREGAAFPPVKKSVSKFQKEQIITGTFGIPLWPFLKNANPLETASSVEIHTDDTCITISLETAMKVILGFSKDGQPLRKDGPVHLYYGDGSNKEAPITNVCKFTII